MKNIFSKFSVAKKLKQVEKDVETFHKKLVEEDFRGKFYIRSFSRFDCKYVSLICEDEWCMEQESLDFKNLSQKEIYEITSILLDFIKNTDFENTRLGVWEDNFLQITKVEKNSRGCGYHLVY